MTVPSASTSRPVRGTSAQGFGASLAIRLSVFACRPVRPGIHDFHHERHDAMRHRLIAETQAALKAQNKMRLSALRLISAALQERDIAARAAIPDQEIPAL